MSFHFLISSETANGFILAATTEGSTALKNCKPDFGSSFEKSHNYTSFQNSRQHSSGIYFDVSFAALCVGRATSDLAKWFAVAGTRYVAALSCSAPPVLACALLAWHLGKRENGASLFSRILKIPLHQMYAFFKRHCCAH